MMEGGVAAGKMGGRRDNPADSSSSSFLKAFDKGIEFTADEVYLDYAGAALPPKSMLSAVFNDMMVNSRGNPHSSSVSQELIDTTRQLVLDQFHASGEQYDIIFTSGATASLKLVGDMLQWGEDGCLCYPMNSHTSVLGLRNLAPHSVSIAPEVLQRQYCTDTKSPKEYSTATTSSNSRSSSKTENTKSSTGSSDAGMGINLLIVPGECNFSGSKASLRTAEQVQLSQQRGLSWLSKGGTEETDNSIVMDRKDACDSINASRIEAKGYQVIKPLVVERTIEDMNSTYSSKTLDEIVSSNRNGWLWLLDAAKLCAGSFIDLSAIAEQERPHFVCMSFYKVFGYPTGLGALLVRRDVIPTHFDKTSKTPLPRSTNRPFPRSMATATQEQDAQPGQGVDGSPGTTTTTSAGTSVAPIISHYKTTSRYFGGGTVQVVAADALLQVPRTVRGLNSDSSHIHRGDSVGLHGTNNGRFELHKQFEEGTPHFLGINSLRFGYAFVREVLGGFEALQRHIYYITRYLYTRMNALVHNTPALAARERAESLTLQPVCVVYGRHAEQTAMENKWRRARTKRTREIKNDKANDCDGDGIDDGDDDDNGDDDGVFAATELPLDMMIQGGVIAFNCMWADGSPVGFSEVGRLAAQRGIALRTGCFCNAGGCQHYLGLSASTVAKNYSLGRVCANDGHDVINGTNTGAVRVSVGYGTTKKHCDAFLALLQEEIVNTFPPSIVRSRVSLLDSLGGNDNEPFHLSKRSHDSTITNSYFDNGPECRKRGALRALAEAAAKVHRGASSASSSSSPSATATATATATASASLSSSSSSTPAGRASSVANVVCVYPEVDPLQLLHVYCRATTRASNATQQTENRSIACPKNDCNDNNGKAVSSTHCCSCSSSSSSSAAAAVATAGVVAALYLYPIKSCAGLRVSAWPVKSDSSADGGGGGGGDGGLWLDREWAIVDSDSNKALTQKAYPRLALLRPHIRIQYPQRQRQQQQEEKQQQQQPQQQPIGILTLSAPPSCGLAPLVVPFAISEFVDPIYKYNSNDDDNDVDDDGNDEEHGNSPKKQDARECLVVGEENEHRKMVGKGADKDKSVAQPMFCVDSCGMDEQQYPQQQKQKEEEEEEQYQSTADQHYSEYHRPHYPHHPQQPHHPHHPHHPQQQQQELSVCGALRTGFHMSHGANEWLSIFLSSTTDEECRKKAAQVAHAARTLALQQCVTSSSSSSSFSHTTTTTTEIQDVAISDPIALTGVTHPRFKLVRRVANIGKEEKQEKKSSEDGKVSLLSPAATAAAASATATATPSFANNAQYLLLTTESVAALIDLMNEHQTMKEAKQRKENKLLDESDEEPGSADICEEYISSSSSSLASTTSSLMSTLKLSTENFRPNLLISTAGYSNTVRSSSSSKSSNCSHTDNIEHITRSDTVLTPHIEDKWDNIVLQLFDLSRHRCDDDDNKNGDVVFSKKGKVAGKQEEEEEEGDEMKKQKKQKQQQQQSEEEAAAALSSVGVCDGAAEPSLLTLQVTGPCARCSMINVDGSTGSFDCRAFEALAGYRRHKIDRQVYFGQFLGGGDYDSADEVATRRAYSDTTQNSPSTISLKSSAEKRKNHLFSRVVVVGSFIQASLR